MVFGSLACACALGQAGARNRSGFRKTSTAAVRSLLRNGPDHRTLLPLAALLGATLLTAGDLVARTAVRPAELPIGILTALLGAPFFLWLLRRRRGGWA
ncbi:MAG: hypothetical protein Fur0014_07480 [Rubrivivax sp.]